jgi:hypothetical protein
MEAAFITMVDSRFFRTSSTVTTLGLISGSLMREAGSGGVPEVALMLTQSLKFQDDLRLFWILAMVLATIRHSCRGDMSDDEAEDETPVSPAPNGGCREESGYAISRYETICGS